MDRVRASQTHVVHFAAVLICGLFRSPAHRLFCYPYPDPYPDPDPDPYPSPYPDPYPDPDPSPYPDPDPDPSPYPDPYPDPDPDPDPDPSCSTGGMPETPAESFQQPELP